MLAIPWNPCCLLKCRNLVIIVGAVCTRRHTSATTQFSIHLNIIELASLTHKSLYRVSTSRKHGTWGLKSWYLHTGRPHFIWSDSFASVHLTAVAQGGMADALRAPDTSTPLLVVLLKPEGLEKPSRHACLPRKRSTLSKIGRPKVGRKGEATLNNSSQQKWF